MNVESIEIPASRVPPVATDAASASKVWAGVLLFFGVLFVIGVVAGPPEQTGAETDPVSMLLGGGILAGVVGFLGFRFVRNASRATRAAALAQTEQRFTWWISGKHIVAADQHGAPRPELSFKISGKLRTMLLAVPRADVVDRH